MWPLLYSYAVATEGENTFQRKELEKEEKGINALSKKRYEKDCRETRGTVGMNVHYSWTKQRGENEHGFYGESSKSIGVKS